MSDALIGRLEARLASPKLTPMMRQYLTVKSEHPDAIVLFRMGDFFETFFEDAEECARRLDITLTARSKERDIPMAGVPHHAIDGYLARLVQQGQTVVIVDQVEDPKQAKGLVRREITRIVTPGTYLDPHAPPRVPNYLVSLQLSRRRKKARWGVAALDLATGELRATSGAEDELLLDELARLDAKEILLSDGQSDDPRVTQIHALMPEILLTRLDAAQSDPAAAEAALLATLGADEMAAVRPHLDEGAQLAAGRALEYARLTQARMEAPDLRGRPSLGHVQTLRPYVPGSALVIDREAREHLELFTSSSGEARGSLVQAIDRAVTSMGGRWLARWLAYPSRDRDEIEARHGAVEALIREPGQLDRLRESLAHVADLERLVGRVVLGRALPKDLEQLAGTLTAAPEVLAAAAEASEDRAGLIDGGGRSLRLAALADIEACADLAGRLGQSLAEAPSNDLRVGQVFREGFDEELDRHTRLATDGRSLIEALESRERDKTGISSLKIRFNKVFGYYIEVTKTNLALVPDNYIRKQTTVNAERYFTDELKELEDEVLSAEDNRVARTEALFVELVEAIAQEAPRLRMLAEALAELDVLGGLAHLAESRDWIRPRMHEGSELEIAEGRHPVLEQLAGDLGERFVPNDVRLSEDERLMIITGPNMAGKSTIMRQTALLVVLAHMGSFVPARAARIGRVDRVFTRVGARDDLSRGRSTFMVEMHEAARILRSATEHDLVILDEIGRGTSTFDGLSIAWAVAEHLHDKLRARTMFATHYHEMTELCRSKAAAVNRHVAVREHEDDIVFLRKLLPGATNRSYGVQVARLAGLPAAVLERAREVLDALEGQALSAEGPGGGTPIQQPAARQQLPLFASPPRATASESVDPRVRKLLDRLQAVAVDDISPRQALDILAELQSLLPRR